MRRSLFSSRPVLAIAGVAIFLQLAGFRAAEAQVAPPRAVVSSISADPVEAAVAEASRRFGVPAHWIRAVIGQESNGDVRAVSSAGAMGLMQVMPGTYAELRLRYGFGRDPFAIRDNILAGTAYLRELHDRYGGLGMLAAYNAGPGRWEEYRAGVRPLPRETIGYLARLGPLLNVGSLPEPSTEAGSSRPSPFAAPIFVTLTGRSDATRNMRDPAWPRLVIASNTSSNASPDALFVRRSETEPRPAPPQSTTQPTSDPRTKEPAPPAPSRQVEQPANSLFPRRSGGDR